MDPKDKKAIITVAILLTMAIIATAFSVSKASAPQAQTTPPPYNAFAYNCSQLEGFVNINMTLGKYIGYNTADLDMQDAQADIQIMQLKGCKVD